MNGFNKYPEELRNKILEYSETHSKYKTSEKFNIAPSTIAMWIHKEKEKKLGIIWRPLVEILNKEEIYDYAKKHSPSEASKHFKVAIDNVYSIIQLLNKLKGNQNPNMRTKNKKNTQIKEVKYGNIEIEEPEEKKIEPTPEPTKQKPKIAIMISDDPEAILNILKGL